MSFLVADGLGVGSVLSDAVLASLPYRIRVGVIALGASEEIGLFEVNEVDMALASRGADIDAAELTHDASDGFGVVEGAERRRFTRPSPPAAPSIGCR